MGLNAVSCANTVLLDGCLVFKQHGLHSPTSLFLPDLQPQPVRGGWVLLLVQYLMPRRPQPRRALHKTQLPLRLRHRKVQAHTLQAGCKACRRHQRVEPVQSQLPWQVLLVSLYNVCVFFGHFIECYRHSHHATVC